MHAYDRPTAYWKQSGSQVILEGMKRSRNPICCEFYPYRDKFNLFFHRAIAISHCKHAISYWATAISCWTHAISHWAAAVSCWTNTIPHWETAISYWATAISCWVNTIFHWETTIFRLANAPTRGMRLPIGLDGSNNVL